MATFRHIDLLSSEISFSQMAGLQYQNEGVCYQIFITEGISAKEA